MRLSTPDQEMLNANAGSGAAMAMRVVVETARVLGATIFIRPTRRTPMTSST